MAVLRNHYPVFLLLLFFCFCLSSQRIGAEKTWEDAFRALRIAWNPDGSLNRTNITIPTVNATPSVEPGQPKPIAFSMDVAISLINNLCVRLFIPSNLTAGQKLPLVINVHGGDFVSFSASTIIFHNFCNDIAAQFPAVVISVEHRLAPENRLPSPYDDTLNAILWARNQATAGTHQRHPWMEYADFSRVFLLGSGAGANIVFHVAIRALNFNLSPLQIKGLLLNQGYFGGIERTPSEIRLEDDSFVPLYVNDVLWELALPIGSDRDHVFCNPFTGGSYNGRVPRLPRVYVKGDYGDPLVDRSTMMVKYLRSYGLPVVYQYGEGGGHGMELLNATAAQELYDGMKRFILYA